MNILSIILFVVLVLATLLPEKIESRARSRRMKKNEEEILSAIKEQAPETYARYIRDKQS